MDKKKTDYEWLTEMNLCHKCRKQKPAPGKKFCFDCLDVIREDDRRRYDPEKAKQYQKKGEKYIEKRKRMEFASDVTSQLLTESIAMNIVSNKKGEAKKEPESEE